MKQYRVTCKSCRGGRQVIILESQGREVIDWLDNNPNPQVVRIISARKRLDGQWGWQCVCGNNDLLTEQENISISDKENPDPSEINSVINNLKVQKPRFNMEVI